jgi:hypothetical protein
VGATSQVHSNTSLATAISPPAALCMLLDALLFLVKGFKQIFYFQIITKNNQKNHIFSLN